MLTLYIQCQRKGFKTPVNADLRPETKTKQYIWISYIQERRTRETRIIFLSINDDLSAYSWLIPHANLDNETGTDALQKWIAPFGTRIWIFVDEAPHFTGSILQSWRGTQAWIIPFPPPTVRWRTGQWSIYGKKYCELLRYYCQNRAYSRWVSVLHCMQTMSKQALLVIWNTSGKIVQLMVKANKSIF